MRLLGKGNRGEALFRAVELYAAEGLQLVELFCVSAFFFFRKIGFDRADQKIFRGILRVDKLRDVDGISRRLKALAAEGVGQRVAEFLFQKGMLQNRRKEGSGTGSGGKFGKELMVTAGSGEDDVGFPLRGGRENNVGRDVTGVEREDEGGLFCRLKRGDVTAEEGEALPVQPGGEGGTEGDDVLLPVGADHRDIPAHHLGEEPIGGKGQIAFPTAKAENVKLAALRETGINVFDVLKETIDLTEFGALAVKDLSLAVGEAEGDEKFTGNAFPENAVLFTVVRLRGCLLSGAELSADE